MPLIARTKRNAAVLMATLLAGHGSVFGIFRPPRGIVPDFANVLLPVVCCWETDGAFAIDPAMASTSSIQERSFSYLVPMIRSCFFMRATLRLGVLGNSGSRPTD